MKGYEVEPGHYVVIEADELAALAPKTSRQIEIEDFVDLSEIDPVYFEQPYYLVPDKDAAKAYRLLVQVMEEKGKVAVGRFVLRSKEALVAIRPVDGMLCLETMRYADEVLAADREGVDPRAGQRAERARAEDGAPAGEPLAGEFDPEKYHDEYREELLALIERKAAGEEIVAPAPRGAGEGARSHGRARGEPGPHRRQGRERNRRRASSRATKRAAAPQAAKAKAATKSARRPRRICEAQREQEGAGEARRKSA